MGVWRGRRGVSSGMRQPEIIKNSNDVFEGQPRTNRICVRCEISNVNASFFLIYGNISVLEMITGRLCSHIDSSF